MPRPFTDISKIDNSKDINNIAAICSTLPTGGSSKLITKTSYPGDLTIENIQQKYGDKFYNGILVETVTS